MTVSTPGATVKDVGPTPTRDRPGRPRATSRAEIERTALDLFAADGFDETTVDDIADAAGIARRTFFRYFPSKNDVVWGDFDTLLGELERHLDGASADQPLWATIRAAVIDFNALAPSATAAHRQRMSLILYVPALQAHSTLRYAAWRAVVERYAKRRLGDPPSAASAGLVAHLALAASVSAYERWLAHPGADLATLLGAAFDAVDLRLGLPTGPSDAKGATRALRE
jgi:mycofactocin system transcriptional regulator